MARARMKPPADKVVQSKSDNGSGVDVAGLDEEDEDEDDDELVVELAGSSVIVTPAVCDTSRGGALALATLSEKFNTPPAASPWPKKLRPSACKGLPF
jgi:hypothetical protein